MPKPSRHQHNLSEHVATAVPRVILHSHVVVFELLIAASLMFFLASPSSAHPRTAQPPPSPLPILYLPFQQSDKLDWINNMRAWFDHHYPDYDAPDWLPHERPVCLGWGQSAQIVPYLGIQFFYSQSARVETAPNGFKINAYYHSSFGGYQYYDGHDGFDWGMPEGTPIQASAAGTVVEASPSSCTDLHSGFGCTIVIDHGNGYKSRYAHLQGPGSSRPWKSAGSVNAGETIALSGNTGASTGPHLHFMVYHNGKVTDPFGFINSDDPLQCSQDGEISRNLWIGWQWGSNMEPKSYGQEAHQHPLNQLPPNMSGIGGNPYYSVPPVGNDNTPPLTSWTNPSNGQTISSQTTHLAANASDDSSGINRVTFSAKWGGQWHGIATVYAAPFSYDWDLCGASVPNGDIELGLEAWDNAGNPYYYSQHFTNYHITKNYNCSAPPPPSPAGWQRDQNCGSDGVTLYERENYQGACLHTSGSAYSSSLRDYSFNDIASSVRIIGNWTLYLFEHDAKGGEIKTINADVANLAGWTFDETASSADVKPRGLCKHIGLAKNPDLPGGISRSPTPDCGDGYFPGTVVTVQFVPDSNSNDIFSYWSGNASGTGLTSQVYVLDESWAIANLVQCQALNVILNPSAGGSVQTSPVPNCGSGYSSSTSVTLVANVNTGYSFGSWSNQASGTTGTTVVPMDADKTVIANFVPAAPSNLRVTGTTPYSISVAWQDNSVSETAFKIYRWNGIGYDNTGSVSANTTSFTESGLDCGKDHYYLVAALDNVGLSQFAGSIRGTTQNCPPTIGNFGNGRDGDLVIADSNDVNPVRASASGPTGSSALAVSGVTGGGFQANTIVLIHQTRGSNAGRWELNTIENVGDGQLVLKTPLTNTYVTDAGASRAQVIWVRQYHNVTISSGGSVSPAFWNGSTGGIVAFLSNGTTLVNGTISTSLRGYSGGVGSLCGDPSSGEGFGGAPVAGMSVTNHSGGGGVNSSAGGGGGNGTAGGNSIRYGSAIGGTTSGTEDLQVMLFGGGGGGGENCSGAGNGGRGGGAILLIAKTLVVNGSIVSNGEGGQTTGGNNSSKAGGGGAGGSILIRGQTVAVNNNLVNALGGPSGIGGSNGGADGGAGGTGRIRVEYCDSLTGSTSPPASMKHECSYFTVNLPTILK